MLVIVCTDVPVHVNACARARALSLSHATLCAVRLLCPFTRMCSLTRLCSLPLSLSRYRMRGEALSFLDLSGSGFRIWEFGLRVSPMLTGAPNEARGTTESAQPASEQGWRVDK